MNEYIILKEKENSLPIDRDLIQIQKTIVHYGQKIDELLNKIEKLQDESKQIKSLLTLVDGRERIVPLSKVEDNVSTNSLINHLRKIR